MSKRERIFLKILCRQNFERNSYILVIKCMCILLIQAYSCIFAYKCISQNLLGQTELILVAVTNPAISKIKFCHSLWIRKRLKKHTPFSQWMTFERRGKLRVVFVKKRDYHKADRRFNCTKAIVIAEDFAKLILRKLDHEFLNTSPADIMYITNSFYVHETHACISILLHLF